MGSRTVADLLEASGPAPARDAARIGADVCRLLEGLHATHGPLGGIGPTTVSLLPGRKVSLAESTAPAEPEQMDAAHARFAAPELLEGGQPTRASDIYSVGALLFNLMTNAVPVEGDSVAALREAHRRGDVKRLSTARVGLPQELIVVVERALSSDPKARFADSASMKAALLAAVAPRASAAPAAPRPPAPQRRTWLYWSIAAGVVVALVAALVLVPRWLGAATPSGGSGDDPEGGVPQVAAPAVRLTPLQRDTLNALSAEVRRVEMVGAHAAARRVTEEALRQAMAALGPESPEIAPIVEDAALVCHAAGDFECAQSLYQQAIMLREKVRGVDQSPRARTLLGMALMLEDVGDLAGAANLREQAAAMPGWSAEDPDAPYRVDVTLMRVSGGGSDRLPADSPLDPDDMLGLEIGVNRAASLYVIDEEAVGIAYLLYPLPAYESRNPMRAGAPLRLPGRVLGRDRHWLMAGAQDGERLLIVVSPEPVQEIENEVRSLPANSYDGKPILASRLSDKALAKLRSLAGQTDPSGRMFPQAARPGARTQPARGVWVRAVGNDATSR